MKLRLNLLISNLFSFRCVFFFFSFSVLALKKKERILALLKTFEAFCGSFFFGLIHRKTRRNRMNHLTCKKKKRLWSPNIQRKMLTSKMVFVENESICWKNKILIFFSSFILMNDFLFVRMIQFVSMTNVNAYESSLKLYLIDKENCIFVRFFFSCSLLTHFHDSSVPIKL